MKKILVLLTALCSIYITAYAQTSKINVANGGQDLICKRVAGKKFFSCNRTKYAENFRVCKNENGYFICNGVNGGFNYSYLQFTGVIDLEAEYNEPDSNHSMKAVNVDKTVPQSQSYINTPAGSH